MSYAKPMFLFFNFIVKTKVMNGIKSRHKIEIIFKKYTNFTVGKGVKLSGHHIGNICCSVVSPWSHSIVIARMFYFRVVLSDSHVQLNYLFIRKLFDELEFVVGVVDVCLPEC